MKKAILLLVVFLNVNNIFSQNYEALVDNQDFFITRQYNDEFIQVWIEDLNDNTVEGTNELPVPEHADIYDFCRIEADRNGDGVFNRFDNHFLRSCGIGNGGIFCWQYPNSASGFQSTDKLLKKHIVYRFTIPFGELVSNNIDTVRFRVILRRQNSLEKSDNNIFFFPIQKEGETFKYFSIPVPKSIVKNVPQIKYSTPIMYDNTPDFFGIYLYDGKKYIELKDANISNGLIETYENSKSSEIVTRSGREIMFIDKFYGYYRIKNSNKGNYILGESIDKKVCRTTNQSIKILAVGDASSISNIKIIQITIYETSQGTVSVRGYPEGTIAFFFGNEYNHNASKTLSSSSVLYNYPTLEKGGYAVIYKGKAYTFIIE